MSSLVSNKCQYHVNFVKLCQYCRFTLPTFIYLFLLLCSPKYKGKKNYQKLYLSTFLETFSLLATQGITINRGAKLFDFTLRKFLQTKHLHCIIQNPAIVDIFF